MRLLYDDDFAPITSEIGFLATDIERVLATFLEWRAEGFARTWRWSPWRRPRQLCTRIAGP